MKKPPVIEFKNVSIIQDLKTNKKILDIDSLVIMPEEDVVILGPNGSGKSTLIKLIYRLYYPEISKKPVVCRIFGNDRWNVFELRSMMGIVTPDLQANFEGDFTVKETVLSGFFSSLGLYNENITAEMNRKTLNAMEFLGINEFSGRKMTEVSTGEARLALIARALVHNPKVLVLDEPTNGLDIKAAHKFRKHLSKVAAAGTNIILITHDLEDIIPEIKRVIMLKEGKVFRDGKIGEILTSQNLKTLFDIEASVIKTKKGFKTEIG